MLCGYEPATKRFGPLVVNTTDIQEAFRLGIRGEAMAPRGGVGLAEGGAPYAAGANEAVLLKLNRLPGLREPRAAYETGRALRMIIRLFDQAGAPERIGRQFIDNLAGAVVVEHLRNRGRPWGATETVDMFIEMYSRIMGGRQVELDRIRRSVMDYAVDTGSADAQRQAGGLAAIFRRRRALNGPDRG
jgi:hypothetical protein